MKKSYIIILLVLAFSSVAICACAEDSIVPKSVYDIDVKYVDEQIEVEQNITYYHSGEPSSEMKLMLYPNAYQSIDTVGGTQVVDDYGEGSIEVEKFGINASEIEYEIGGYLDTVLTAPLDSEIRRGDSVDIYIKYTLHLPRCNARLGISDEGVVNLSNFYAVVPSLREGVWGIDDYVYIGDPYVSDIKDMHICMSIPTTHTLAHGAHSVSTTTEGEWKKIDMTYIDVRDVAMSISAKYLFTKMDMEGIDITYYYYKDHDYLNTAYIARNSLRYFQEKFGKYPYPTYTIAETPLMAGGMEYSGFCMINSSLNDSDREETVVHETAHQWWYNIVGNDNVYEPWIDEGLAEYSTIMYLGEIYGDEWVKNRVYSTQNAYMLFSDLKDKVYNDVDNSMDRSIYEYNGTLEYTYLVYLKTMLMHARLHDMLGEKYIHTLKRIVEENRLGTITKDTLISTFTKVSGRKMQVIFDAWLKGRVFILPMSEY